jgi:general secretion pathway protein L
VVETLFIRLGSQAHHTIHWLIAAGSNTRGNNGSSHSISGNSDTFEIIGSGELANAEQLSELTDKAAQRVVKIIVPSSDVLLKRLSVPAKSNRAMRLAVPYMLEDNLAQDVDQLFFAYAELKKDSEENNCFTAIVAHKQIEQWLEWLNVADIEANVFVPEVLTLPKVANAWSAIALGEGDRQQTIVRQGAWQGFTLDLATWQLQCQAMSSPQSDNDDVDQNADIQVNSYSPLAYSEQLNINSMPEELPLALMAKNYHHSDNFNLLQGKYKVKDRQVSRMQPWYWVAAVAVFALCLNFTFTAVQLWQVNAQKAQVEAQIISQYKKAFPQTKRVRIATIKSQLNQKLAQLGGANDSAGFLAMLAKVTPAFSKVPTLKPASLKFDNKRQELRIQATASNYQTFEQFTYGLEQEGLTVKQGAQNNQGSQVTGSFSIRNDNKNKRSNKRSNKSNTKQAERGAS